MDIRLRRRIDETMGDVLTRIKVEVKLIEDLELKIGSTDSSYDRAMLERTIKDSERRLQRYLDIYRSLKE